MTVKDLITELQKYPEGYDVKIPAHLDIVTPDELITDNFDVNYIVLPITEIENNIDDKYIYLLFDIEAYAKYEYYQQHQQINKEGN